MRRSSRFHYDLAISHCMKICQFKHAILSEHLTEAKVTLGELEIECNLTSWANITMAHMLDFKLDTEFHRAVFHLHSEDFVKVFLFL